MSTYPQAEHTGGSQEQVILSWFVHFVPNLVAVGKHRD